MLGNALNAMLGDWRSNQIDAQPQPAWNALTPPFVNNNKVDLSSALSQFQVYNPQTIAGQLQAIQNAAVLSNADIEVLIDVIQREGMAFYIDQAVGICRAQSSDYSIRPINSYGPAPDYKLVPKNGPCRAFLAKMKLVLLTGFGILGYLLRGISSLGIGPLRLLQEYLAYFTLYKS